MRRLAILLFLSAFSIAPATASAASLSVSDGTAFYLGDDGEDIALSVSQTDEAVAFSDVVEIDALAPCTSNGTSASCPAAAVARLDIRVAGFDNTAINGTALPSVMQGGDAFDTLIGGSAADTLRGGDGPDRLIGNAGADVLRGQESTQDTASYEGRAERIVAAFGGGADDGSATDGPAGARDDIGEDVEIIVGGEAGDELSTGTAGGTVEGRGGNDVLRGSAADDALYGGPEDDDLEALAGDDYLIGDDGVDSLNGGPGRDQLGGGAGRDSLDGGDGGEDLVMYGAGEALRIDGIEADLDAETGDDGNALDGPPGARDTIAGVEGLRGTDYDDVLTGNDGDNVIDGRDGVDRIAGGAGVDRLTGGDYFYPQASDGDDEITGGPGDDEILGSKGDDTITAGPGDDVLEGGLGADVVRGEDGKDLIKYGEILSPRTKGVTVSLAAGGTTDGSDEDESGGKRDDVGPDVESVFGTAFGDVIVGGTATGTLDGNDGPDDVTGSSAADDLIIGGDGDDTLRARDGLRDSVHCGAGTDTAIADQDVDAANPSTTGDPAEIGDCETRDGLTGIPFTPPPDNNNNNGNDGGDGTPPPTVDQTPAPVTPAPSVPESPQPSFEPDPGPLPIALDAPSKLRIRDLKAGKGAPLRWNQTYAGPFELRLYRKVAGHRRGKRCLPGKRRGRRKCTARRKVGTLKATAPPGAHEIELPARLGGRALKPGRYTVVIEVFGDESSESLRLTR